MTRFATDVTRCIALLLVAGLSLGMGACAGGDADREQVVARDTVTATAAAPIADTTTISVADAGFQTPESVLHDEAADVYLVSNINGGPLGKDDNGFISRLSPDGQVTEIRWIDGQREGTTLHAPKGMALKGDSLFVTDIDSVRIFHRNTGAALAARGIPNATFLNDAAAGTDGTIYITDSGMRAGAQGFEPAGTDAVYRFGPDGAAVALASGTDLTSPNGIAVDGQAVLIAPFGGKEIYKIDPSGARTSVATLPAGQLDGLIRLADGSLLVSRWEASSVYRVSPAGDVQTLASGLESPADIGYDARRNRVLIPLFMQNRVELRPVR